MSYNTAAFDNIDLILLRFVGDVDTAVLIDGAREAAGLPEWRPGMNSIIDLDPAHLDINYERMNSLVSERSSQVSEQTWRKMAIVAAAPRNFGIARMYQQISDQTGLWEECQVFTTMAEARSWLDIPEDFELTL